MPTSLRFKQKFLNFESVYTCTLVVFIVTILSMRPVSFNKTCGMGIVLFHLIICTDSDSEDNNLNIKPFHSDLP